MKGVRILCLCGLLAIVGAAQTSPAKRPSPPDVFLVTIDTLRADHVHCYGYDRVETPALDGLAKEGIRFTAAFTPSPITNTSHTTILTGLLPVHHGVTDFAVPLAASHLTLAEMLKKKGYHTGAFIGAVILDSKTLAPGLDRGFDFYDNFPEHTDTKARWGRVERRGMDVVKDAETWLHAHPAGPHFVWVHLYDPHDPYEPPTPYSETYKDHLYDGEIAYADSALANFLAFVKKAGWYENSLIIVVGDHGEGLGEHHENTHGIFLYDSTTHVPLIVKLPAKSGAGKVVDAQVRTMDIVPTALDVVHASVPSGLDGASLRPYFVGTDTKSRIAYGETDYPLRFGWAPLRSVRADGFKLIQAPRSELYDLRTDPGELQNTYQATNSAAVKLQPMLSEVYSKAPAATSADGATTEGAKNDLKALGYTTANNVANLTGLPDPKDKIEEQNLLHTAMMAADDGRSADARDALEKVLQLDPKSPTALRQLGELELQAGDFAKAAEHLKRAREVRPEDATAAFYEGQARSKIGDFAGARDALEASLKLTPGQLEARLLLGNAYLGLKDAKAAADQFEAAQLLDAKSAAAQIGLARAQVIAGSFADAVQQLEPLTASEPNNAQVFETLAQAYQGLGKTAEAQKAADRAKSLAAPPRQ
jgi:arylsulfatase A-like enzyme/Tfp pilus assembly protein PilF